jgi:hypothetical protein
MLKLYEVSFTKPLIATVGWAVAANVPSKYWTLLLVLV